MQSIPGATARMGFAGFANTFPVLHTKNGRHSYDFRPFYIKALLLLGNPITKPPSHKDFKVFRSKNFVAPCLPRKGIGAMCGQNVFDFPANYGKANLNRSAYRQV